MGDEPARGVCTGHLAQAVPTSQDAAVWKLWLDVLKRLPGPRVGAWVS